MAMTAHPTVTVVKIATKGTSESPELDHLDPVKRSNVKTLYKQTKSSIKYEYQVLWISWWKLTIDIFTNALRKFKGSPASSWMAFQKRNTFHSVAGMALISNFWKNCVCIFRRCCHKSVAYRRRWITKLERNWKLSRIYQILSAYNFNQV